MVWLIMMDVSPTRFLPYKDGVTMKDNPGDGCFALQGRCNLTLPMHNAVCEDDSRDVVSCPEPGYQLDDKRKPPLTPFYFARQTRDTGWYIRRARNGQACVRILYLIHWAATTVSSDLLYI